nr:hypothetical protein [Tanacetum cinerariifolium]
DHGVKSSQNPPPIDECCRECGNALDGIFCQQCICKSCGKGAHIGYNCLPKVLIISNPEPCNQTINNELPQTLPSFDSAPCISKPNFVDESFNIFNPPPQHPIYSCEFCWNDAYFGYYCTPQAQFNNLKQGYSQDFNFSGPHETFQCQPTNEDYCYEQNSCYNSNSFGFVYCQPSQSSVIHQPPQELSIQEMEDLKQQYLDELKRLINLEYHDEIKIAKLTENLNGISIEIQKKEKLLQQEQWAYLSTHPSKRLTSFCYDDDEDYNSAITPVLSTEEPVDSLSMGDDHLDTILATESDEVIKYSVEDLIPIPKDFFESNNEVSLIDDDSFSIENIDYVEASPPDSELVSSEVMEIFIPEVGGIDDDILLTIKDDILRENLLNVNLLITKIEAFNDNPTPSSDCKTKSSSTSPKSLLEETNTFHNSLSEFEKFYFNLGEISSGSTTTHSNISLPDYEAFYFDDDHIKEISSGSTTTQSDISLSKYDSFIFDFTHEEFADELAHIISPPEYDCFYFWNLLDPGELIYVLNSGIRENLPSVTSVNLPIEDDYSPLLAYVASPFIIFIRLSLVHLIGMELSRNSILTAVT